MRVSEIVVLCAGTCAAFVVTGVVWRMQDGDNMKDSGLRAGRAPEYQCTVHLAL